MTPDNLNPELKEHIKTVHRNNSHLSMTWGLFQMFIQHPEYIGKPHLALSAAREAMEVWVEYEDANVAEMPDVPVQTFDVPLEGSGENFMKMFKEGIVEASKVLRKANKELNDPANAMLRAMQEEKEEGEDNERTNDK